MWQRKAGRTLALAAVLTVYGAVRAADGDPLTAEFWVGSNPNEKSVAKCSATKTNNRWTIVSEYKNKCSFVGQNGTRYYEAIKYNWSAGGVAYAASFVRENTTKDVSSTTYRGIVEATGSINVTPDFSPAVNTGANRWIPSTAVAYHGSVGDAAELVVADGSAEVWFAHYVYGQNPPEEVVGLMEVHNNTDGTILVELPSGHSWEIEAFGFHQGATTNVVQDGVLVEAVGTYTITFNYGDSDEYTESYDACYWSE